MAFRRVFAITRVTKNFNCKLQCTGRRYEYVNHKKKILVQCSASGKFVRGSTARKAVTLRDGDHPLLGGQGGLGPVTAVPLSLG